MSEQSDARGYVRRLAAELVTCDKARAMYRSQAEHAAADELAAELRGSAETGDACTHGFAPCCRYHEAGGRPDDDCGPVSHTWPEIIAEQGERGYVVGVRKDVITGLGLQRKR